MTAFLDSGGPAYPQVRGISVGDLPPFSGMSLRDWFAGMALSGMAARDVFDEGQATPQQRARLAYIDADAMLDESEKPK